MDNDFDNHAAAETPQDSARRFLFDEADIRGETVHLDTTLSGILDGHQYAPGVSRLIGEFVAAAVLISSTLKFDGRLTLQARSKGQIPLLMAECNRELEVRAIARGAQEATANTFNELIGEGQLAITVEPTQGKRYQGIVPLSGESFAECLDAYFQQSEQLHTRLWLSCDGNTAAGLLLQQLPSKVAPDPAVRAEQWQHACALAATISGEELLSLSSADLLYRLYHQDLVRLFDPRAPRFRCSCSRDRSHRALQSLGEAEISSILEEQGSVTMDCEFCSQRYIFTPDDFFAQSGKTLH